MAVRPFAGVQTLTGNAQPVFGTATTAAFAPPPDPFSGNNNPGSNQTQVTVVVTSTHGFRPGDEVLVGAAAAFNPGLIALGTGPDRGMVKSVVDATHLLVQGLQHAHASGEYVVLNEDAGNVHIIPVVTTGAVYIGDASTVAAADPSVIDILPITAAGAAPGYVHDSESIGMTQPFQTSGYWIKGTANDTFLARYSQV